MLMRGTIPTLVLAAMSLSPLHAQQNKPTTADEIKALGDALGETKPAPRKDADKPAAAPPAAPALPKQQPAAPPLPAPTPSKSSQPKPAPKLATKPAAAPAKQIEASSVKPTVKPAAPATAPPPASIPAAPTPVPAAVPAPPAPAAPPATPVLPIKDRALQIITEAAVGQDPALRSNAIEAIQVMPERARPIVHRGLTDTNAGVRFAAIVTAGQLRFAELAPAIRPLTRDANASVQAAALYALYSLGEKVDITPLGDMLRGRDPKLRGNVALLLGLLGDGSAVTLLKSTANVPMPRASAAEAAVSRVQVAEAVAKLGDDSALDALRAGAYSSFDEVRVLSVLAMGAVGDRRMELALDKLLPQPPVEIQLAAAGSLARLGSAKGLEFAKSAALTNTSPVIRAQAAWALGWFGDTASLAVLDQLLADGSRQVRVAAAASVLRRVAKGA